MTIDIITFTDAQYSALSETQLLEVIAAQTRKDNMTLALAEKKRKERFRLIKNGTFRSGIYDALCLKWDEEYQAELALVKEKLLFYLRFALKPENTPTATPYPLDYSLEYTERFKVVRDYYLTTYPDAQERMEVFREDGVAPQFLGEYYATLYDYLLDLASNA